MVEPVIEPELVEEVVEEEPMPESTLVKPATDVPSEYRRWPDAKSHT